MTTESLKEGEVLFEGVRVEKAVGQRKVVLAWSGDVRYGAKKRGYHGGANPQEMVVPFAILSGPNSIPAGGWKEIHPTNRNGGDHGGDFALTLGADASKSKKGVEAAKESDLFEQAEAKEPKVPRPGSMRCSTPSSIRNN